jgi:hypothetical protein
MVMPVPPEADTVDVAAVDTVKVYVNVETTVMRWFAFISAADTPPTADAPDIVTKSPVTAP